LNKSAELLKLIFWLTFLSKKKIEETGRYKKKIKELFLEVKNTASSRFALKVLDYYKNFSIQNR
jgi:hypothetical protein